MGAVGEGILLDHSFLHLGSLCVRLFGSMADHDPGVAHRPRYFFLTLQVPCIGACRAQIPGVSVTMLTRAPNSIRHYSMYLCIYLYLYRADMLFSIRYV